MQPIRILAGSFALVAILGLATPAPAAEMSAKIVRTWKAKCASCHGVDGKADTDQGKSMAIPDMTTAGWQKAVTDDRMKESISKGLKRPGKSEGMDPFGDTLSEAQITELVALVRSLAK